MPFDLAALAAPLTAAGIERTSAGLRLARLRRVRASLVVTHTGFVPLPPEAGPEDIAAAAAERLKAWGAVEGAAFGLDHAATALRSFRFPFGGRRQIAAVLPQEFADASPLPPQQYCLAQSDPLPGPDGDFIVHAAAANRADAVALVRAFSGQGIALRGLFPAWAVLPRVVRDTGRDIGRDTGGAGQGACFVELNRAFEAYALISGESGAETVRAALCHPYGEKEGGQEEGRERGSEAVDQLAGRIAFFMDQAGSADRIVITGDEAGNGSLMRQLGDRLGLPVERLEELRAISAAAPAPERFAVAEALATSLLAPRSEEGMNFLTGDLEPPSTMPAWLRTLRNACAAACLVVACLCVLETAHGLREQIAARGLRQTLFRAYREVLPDVPPAAPEHMERIMENRLREWREGTRLTPGAERESALGILTAVHQAIPSDMRVVADALSLSGDRLALSGTVPDFKAADALREKLAELSVFEEVRLKSAQRGEQQRVRYEIEGTIRQPAHDGRD